MGREDLLEWREGDAEKTRKCLKSLEIERRGSKEHGGRSKKKRKKMCWKPFVQEKQLCKNVANIQ